MKRPTNLLAVALLFGNAWASSATNEAFEVLAEVESSLWSLDTLQEWAWNPLMYVDLAGSSIYRLLAGDFAPLEDRLLDAASRLEQFPRFLEQAREAIDSAIHVDGMTRDEAMKLMIEGGFQEEREAAGKWVRAQLTSAQLSTYFVGYQEHAEMRNAVQAEWGDEFTLRRYHDQALSYGSPPVKYIRALILGEKIPLAQQ